MLVINANIIFVSLIITVNKSSVAMERKFSYQASMSELNTATNDAEHMDDVRARIVSATAGLIASGGRDAATTRAIAAAAAVQAPTIYRLFGDKRGLLDAVAENVFATYVADKSVRQPHPDPIQDLRDGWDMHVAFGLAHPEIFAIISSDPHPRSPAPAVAAGLKVLQRRIRAIALAGRLRISEARAVALLQAVGTGTVLTLLGQPEETRDFGLSEIAREAVVDTITGAPSASEHMGATGAAVALHASLDSTSVLTDGERHLLGELLKRIADGD